MTTVTHRRYVPYAHAHYAGNLVDGAYALGLFGDAATEVCMRTDGDEGLFASYSDVQFRAAIRARDVVVCADIGSTYTKVAAVDVGTGALVATAAHPTTLATDVLHGLDAAVDA